MQLVEATVRACRNTQPPNPKKSGQTVPYFAKAPLISATPRSV
jgi:hypothetical protein